MSVCVCCVHPLPYFLTDDAAERMRRGNIPQCHAARPMGQMDGWMDRQTQADGWIDGRMDASMDWVDATVSCSPHTLCLLSLPPQQLALSQFLKHESSQNNPKILLPVVDLKIEVSFK